jgi:F-box protein 9
MASNDIKSELESFREQWRAEVRSKVPSSQNDAQQTVAGPSTTQPRSQKAQKSHLPPKPPVASGKKVEQQDEDEDEESVHPLSFDEPEPAVDSPSSSKAEMTESTENQDLSSALEHYEQAVEKEAAGNLGDSLRLYRKAYRVSTFAPVGRRLSEGSP